jgi:2-C-methyl-D-erythritol 4-phosphate cytidylyltransferase
MNIALILAGGIGSRVGAKIPKQFIEIQGKPILAYTLENFNNDANINAIEIVCHKGWMDFTKKLVGKYGINKVKWFVDGGETFQESTINGINNLKGKVKEDDIVVISFGVSPMTTSEIIDDNIRVCKQYGNAIASEEVVLLTCFKDNDYSTVKGLPRENLMGFSNPWSFKYGEISNVFKEGREKGILSQIDPHITSLYLALGKRLYFSKSNSLNIKITRKEDLDIFEGYLLLKEKREKENDQL